MTTVKVKRSTSTALPTTTFGELAYTNISGVSNLYIGNSANNPVLIGSSNFTLNDTVDTTSITGTISGTSVINVCTVASNITRTLPTASTSAGRKVIVANSSTSTANVTISGAVAPIVLNPTQSALFESDGTTWYIVAEPGNDIVDTTSTTGTINVATGLNVVTTSSAVTRTLPSATILRGQKITVINAVSSGANITVIGAATSVSLAAGRAAIFESDGVNWQIISNSSNSTGIGGSGTTNQFAYFTGSSTLTSSSIFSQVSNQLVVGAGDQGTPTATVIRGAQSSGSNIAGANLTIQGSNGTGAGGGGDIIFQTAPAQISPPVATALASFGNSNVNTITASVTIPNVLNRVLLVQIALSSPSVQNSSVTYNGSPLILLRRQSSGSSCNEVWYLIAPPVGTANLVMTLTGFAGICGRAIMLSNANQTSPFGTVVSTNGNGNFASLTPASSIGQIVVDLISVANVTPSISGGQTSIWTGNTGTGIFAQGSFEASTAGTTSVSYTFVGSNNFSYIAFAVNTPPVTTANVMNEIIRLSSAGDLKLSGGLILPIISTGTSGNISSLVTFATASNITLTLPVASANTGRVFIIKNIAPSSIYINSSGGSIDNDVTDEIGDLCSKIYISNGANWWSI